ncbi:response regulator [Woodsholea maritima]|uniref:response regulator n=1 Tax=Woodsholea maritima TaxID=240237 RepID=UPI0003727922|nr:response regulator [Woodsholea maritima]
MAIEAVSWQEQEPQSVKDWRERLVIICDPFSFTRQLMRDILRHAGARAVETTQSPEDALNALAIGNQATLLMDWQDNSTQGLHAIRQLRQSPKHARQTPIMVVSARNRFNDVASARDAGANEYLLKPISPNRLIARLDQIQDSPRAFILTEGFTGPDRRRRRPRPLPSHNYKRDQDIEAGLTDPLQAAMAQADSMSFEMLRRGDPIAARVGRSLRFFLERVDQIDPEAQAIIGLHRATLNRIRDLYEARAKDRLDVIHGLEKIVGRHAHH